MMSIFIPLTFYFGAGSKLFFFNNEQLKMSNSLDLLKQTGTVVVSDSGDFEC